jgi:hypothetical protein
MKRKLIYVAGFVLIAWSVTSCDSLFKNCKYCKQVQTDDATGNILWEGSESEYCGADLIKVEAIPDASALGKTMKYVCR